ncbi:MAG: T9SS type A sorting domain-containing protein [bacterium]|nr:T9SS type A sorting domain-containing protein [bacterium]
MRKIILVTVFVVLFSCTSAAGRIINIPDDYNTIQEGIDASSNGDTVLVHPDIYYENINFNGHNITLGSLYLSTGDTLYIESTIIDGNMDGTVVTFENGEDSTAIISGFTIQNGLNINGGGISCSTSHPMIIKNRIIENVAYDSQRAAEGGGIYCWGSNPKIYHNVIYSNRSSGWYAAGGGICCNSSNAIIEYNVIRENAVFYWGFGAGICIANSSPIIRNNVIIDNSAESEEGKGGGISCIYSNPLIIGNTICDNIAHTRGGGIHCRGSNSMIIDNIIEGNLASGEGGKGGGISVIGLNPVIANNIIRGNSADYNGRGGGICCFYSFTTLCNNTLIENIAHIGGGFYSQYDSSLTLNNNIINSSRQGGIVFCHSNFKSSNNTVFRTTGTLAGFVCYSSANGIITNTILWENYPDLSIDSSSSISVTYCDTQDTLWLGWPGVGNISIDPLFRDAGHGDFHLQDNIDCGDNYYSPCIDAGHPEILDTLIACEWGLGDVRSDMGAYGGGDDWLGIEPPVNAIPKGFVLSQNYPNPFNPTTTIRYALPQRSQVKLDIFNILGQKVETLVNNPSKAGEHSVSWDATTYPSGIYFYKMTIDGKTYTKRMTLLK